MGEIIVVMGVGVGAVGAVVTVLYLVSLVMLRAAASLPQGRPDRSPGKPAGGRGRHDRGVHVRGPRDPGRHGDDPARSGPRAAHNQRASQWSAAEPRNPNVGPAFPPHSQDRGATGVLPMPAVAEIATT